MILNDAGEIAKKCWSDLPQHYVNCILDEWIMMPNHVHGIIFIDNAFVGAGFKPAPTIIDGTGLKPVPTQHGLSEIIRGFKTFSG